MSDVRLLVFNNGMQILGDFVGTDAATGKIHVKKPVQVILVPNEQSPKGQMGMAFAPFMQYTEEWSKEVPFSVNDVLTVLTPLRELVNNYNTTFGTGLVLPPGV